MFVKKVLYRTKYSCIFFTKKILLILMNYRKMPRTIIQLTNILRFNYNFSSLVKKIFHSCHQVFLMFLHNLFFLFEASIFFLKKPAHWMHSKRKEKENTAVRNCRYLWVWTHDPWLGVSWSLDIPDLSQEVW